MKSISLILFASAMVILTCFSSCKKQKSTFNVADTDQKLVLLEDSKPVFVYQKRPKSLNGQYVCNNYIHPLFNLHGDIITEEFPADHPYHRGVFWAWHQLYADGKRLGDGWMNDSIRQELISVKSEKTNRLALISLKVLWYSSTSDSGKPFIEENTNITVHKLQDSIRKIDFEIALKALVQQLQIGGSADQKGYGGFCVRMRLPDSLKFTSEMGPVVPQELQIKAGPWMDFSGRFGDGPEISGITILCNPGMPDYPEPWILRQKGSMQNIVFPGQQKIDIPMDKPVILHYRLVIHNGNAGSLDLNQLQKEYSKIRSN